MKVKLLICGFPPRPLWSLCVLCVEQSFKPAQHKLRQTEHPNGAGWRFRTRQYSLAAVDEFKAADANFESRVRAGFEQQALMGTLGARLTKVAAGEVVIEMPFDTAFAQQDGFLHAGTVTSIADSACGFAAYSLMRASERVLSVEFKVNLLRPARGERFIAIGKVVKAGRTLTVCSGEVVAIAGTSEKLVAMMQATMIVVEEKP